MRHYTSIRVFLLFSAFSGATAGALPAFAVESPTPVAASSPKPAKGPAAAVAAAAAQKAQSPAEEPKSIDLLKKERSRLERSRTAKLVGRAVDALKSNKFTVARGLAGKFRFDEQFAD